MKQATFLLPLMSAGLFVATAAIAQGTGDPRRGLTAARQVCAQCHAVENTVAPSPNERAPSFRTIAATPGTSELALYSAVRTPHPEMPSLVPDSAELKNIIAYIMTLQRE